jgi:hypothetical protein
MPALLVKRPTYKAITVNQYYSLDRPSITVRIGISVWSFGRAGTVQHFRPWDSWTLPMGVLTIKTLSPRPWGNLKVKLLPLQELGYRTSFSSWASKVLVATRLGQPALL